MFEVRLRVFGMCLKCGFPAQLETCVDSSHCVLTCFLCVRSVFNVLKVRFKCVLRVLECVKAVTPKCV